MKWKKVKKGMAIPELNMLCVDAQQNYYVGHIFKEEASSTGFVCVESNEAEHDCVAYSKIDNAQWISPQSSLPGNYQQVLCQSIDGRTMFGSLKKSDGYYLAENETEVFSNVIAWQQVKKFVPNAKILRFERWIALAAVCALSIWGSQFIDAVTNNNQITYAQTSPSLDLPADRTVDRISCCEKNVTDTNDFLNSDPYMNKANIIEIAYDGYLHRENFAPERFFIDNNNRKHYVDENGKLFIFSDNGLYIISEDSNWYRCTSDFFVNFLYAGVDAHVLDFIEKEPYGKIVITYNDQEHVERFNPHALVIDDDYGTFYLGYGNATYEINNNMLYVTKDGQEEPQIYTNFKMELTGDANSWIIAANGNETSV